jgi:PAS domain S-box-containing protein
MDVAVSWCKSGQSPGIVATLGDGPIATASLVPLLSELPVPICVTRAEADGRILFANHAAAELAGLPLEELLRRNAAELYADPADRVRLLEELRRNGRAVDAELRFRTPHGRLLWVLLSARLITVDGERLLVASIQDIDERHRAQERVAALLHRIEEQNAELEARVAERTRELAEAHDAAARSQAQLVDAIEAMSDGFALWDAEDRFVLCNSKYRNEHSLAPDKLRPGTPHRRVLAAGVARGLVPHGYDRASWIAERLARHRDPGSPCIVRGRDGRSVRMSEYRTREGGTVSIRTDITELVRRTEALEQSQRLLQGVIDAVPATISVKDRESRYVLVNRYHGETFGAPEATIGRTSFDLLGGRYGADARQLDLQVIEGGEGLPFNEREFVDVTGRPRTWFTAKLPLKDGAGEVAHVVTVALDITQLKATERARANLSRYFAPNMVELLAASDEPFGPARHQEIALLFVDIVGFTRLCSEAPAETVFDLLRAFLKRMAACVFECAGTLDKYTGDGMMATFGTPEPGERDATRALRCANAMRREMAAWNEALRADGREPIEIAIGAHFGPALLGNLGSERRLDFGVVGDTANVANRLEKLARPLSAELVVSEALVDRVRLESGDAAPELAGLVRLGPRRLRGRDAPVPVWVTGVGDGVVPQHTVTV